MQATNYQYLNKTPLQLLSNLEKVREKGPDGLRTCNWCRRGNSLSFADIVKKMRNKDG